jgi:hypothetical protein
MISTTKQCASLFFLYTNTFPTSGDPPQKFYALLLGYVTIEYHHIRPPQWWSYARIHSRWDERTRKTRQNNWTRWVRVGSNWSTLMNMSITKLCWVLCSVTLISHDRLQWLWHWQSINKHNSWIPLDVRTSRIPNKNTCKVVPQFVS